MYDRKPELSLTEPDTHNKSCTIVAGLVQASCYTFLAHTIIQIESHRVFVYKLT